jgi:formiminotetrahydrofolate cyclodeaminase
MEAALREACGPPLDIMRVCARAIELLEELAEKGSALAVSDAGAGAALCGAALAAASLNVYINAKSMADGEWAEKVTSESNALLAEYRPRADNIFAQVLRRLV